MTGLAATWWRELSSQPMALAALAAIACCWVASCWLVWRQVRAPGWRAAWLAATAGYAVLVLLILFPPLTRSGSDTTVVVTVGATDALLSAVPPMADAFVDDAAWSQPTIRRWIERRTARARSGRTIRIAGMDDLAFWAADAAVVTLLGDGYDEATWAQFRWPGQLRFAAPDIAGAGIAELEWTRRVPLGTAAVVDVRATTDTPAAAQWLVSDASGRALARAAVDVEAIELPRLPSGRHELALALIDGDATLERAALGIEVVRPPPARVLLLQSAPSFEWRAFGRWLADAGAQLSARVRVSEARYRERFEEAEPRALAPLGAELLSTTDLVVLDGRMLGLLDAEKRDRLLSARHGAGVLIWLHDRADLEALPAPLRASLSGDADGERRFQLAGTDALATGLTRLAVTPGVAPASVLARDTNGDALVAEVAPGVAVSLVRDSYRLIGAGASDAYERFWARLVRRLSRPAVRREASFAPTSAERGQRLRVCLPRASAPPSVALESASGERIALTLHASPWRPAESCGWLWPNEAGWLSVLDETGDRLERRGWFWVAERDSMAIRSRRARIAATLARATTASPPPAASTETVTQPMSRPPLFAALALLLVLTAAIERVAPRRS